MCATHYTITPLSVGMLTNDHAQLVWGQQFGTKVQIPVLMFLVQGGGRHFLVDTGCSEPESAAKYHYPFVRKPEEDPKRALEAAGVAPEEIDTVVATHLHWDHCYNHELFTNARFFIQRSELQFAAAPYPIFANAYEAPTTGMTPPYSGTKFELLDGDLDLADGLKIVYAPGHTPGMQCLLVSTSAGTYYVAGDNVALYENLEGNRFGKPIPGINFVNLGEYYATLRQMERLADHILPGHDVKVLDKAVYP
jgi:N-acyl homoserine lactone hydrolase